MWRTTLRGLYYCLCSIVSLTLIISFSYQLCLFKNITQADLSVGSFGTSRISLGAWQEFILSSELSHPTIIGLKYLGGNAANCLGCRHSEVYFNCSDSMDGNVKISGVNEESPCFYSIHLSGKIFCDYFDVYSMLSHSRHRHSWAQTLARFEYGITTLRGFQNDLHKILTDDDFVLTKSTIASINRSCF